MITVKPEDVLRINQVISGIQEELKAFVDIYNLLIRIEVRLTEIEKQLGSVEFKISPPWYRKAYQWFYIWIYRSLGGV